MLGGLGGAGAEELNAAEPQAGDAVVLLAFAGCVEMEENAGPWGRAVEGWGVRGGEGRGVDGVGEGVAEDEVGARRGGLIGGERIGDLEVLLGTVAREREGVDVTVLVGEGRGWLCEEGKEEEEEEEE